jgi:hypothetical protein
MSVDGMTPQDLDLVYREFGNHASFCRSSLIVETEGKQLVPMEPGPGQLRLNEAIRKQRAKGVPVRLIYLKSRRIQATTGTASQFFHNTAFRAGVHTAVIAHDDTSTQNIFGIYKRFHERYKPFAGVIRLPVSSDRTRHRDDPGLLADRIYYEYGGDPKSSFIQVKTAGSANFGRSFRLTNVHFSEFPYYERPAEILASVMSAVPKLPDTCAVIEGTAKTIGDLFHRMWQTAVDPSQESEWVGLFMAWWEHPTNRMSPSVSPDRFMDSLSAEEREIMGRFSLDLKQLAWRRWTIRNDFLGDEVRFKREHPATPEEAFTASSRNRFSVPHIQRMPIQREPLCGELVIDPIGIEKRLVFLPGERGALRVWRKPEKGRLYACGADCAQGEDVNPSGRSDPDYSVGQIVDRDTGEQVAVLRARLMPGETGRYMARLCAWYNMAQCCGERNPGGGGISMLEAMLNADYPSSLLYHRSVTPDQDPQVRGDRIGWDTSGVSRPMLLGYLDEAIRQEALAIHDPITQQELLTFVLKPNGKPEAQAGCHDDCVIALALVIIVVQRMPRPIPLSPHGIVRPEVRKYGQAPRDADRRGQNVRLR